MRVALLALALVACRAPGGEDRGSFSFTLENDTFTGSDNNYSNGMSFAWASPERAELDPDGWLEAWIGLWDGLPMVADEGASTHASFSIGQQVYTPHDIDDPTPPPDDQPYAGLLVLDAGLHNRREAHGLSYNLRLGLVGPAARADHIQTEFHELIDAAIPAAWHTQLPNEAIVNVDVTGAQLLFQEELDGALAVRMAGLGTASLGNFFTGAGATAYLELGWNLQPALGGTALRHGFSSASTIGAGPLDGHSLSLTAALSGYAIGHYLPLDGTVFRDSASVDTEPFVGAITYGLSYRTGSFVLGLGQSFFSDAFETQRQRAEFGTISLAWFL